MRNSASHPIQIAEITCANGLLGVTLCPGKKGSSLSGPDWDRDMDIDLAAIKSWNASIIVTLIENREFEILDVQHLGKSIETLGMRWLHAPIRDVSIPDQGFEKRWGLIGHLIRTALINGERVLIHCRGGLGRAGLIAARLLAEFGMPADEAIAYVRKQRSGAIETRQQENYVRAITPLTHDHQTYDRILGCLFGGAVGDAFGYTIEFDRIDRIKTKYGPKGLQDPELVNGRFVVSDDTQMTLFTAEALLKPAPTLDAIKTAYLDWFRTQYEPHPSDPLNGLLAHTSLWANRAPGNTCLSALGSGQWGSTEQPINNSKGCGGIMRVAPIGFLTALSKEEIYDLGAQSAALTHGHPLGYMSSGLMAVLVTNLIQGQTSVAALSSVIELMKDKDVHPDLKNLVGQALGLAAESLTSDYDLLEIRANEEIGIYDAISTGRLGEGWVAEEALAIGLHAFLAADTYSFETHDPVEGFKKAIRQAANHSGDSDSTASIAGQIFGARYGLNAIPWGWIACLDVLDPMCELADKLVRFASAPNNLCLERV